MNLASGIDWNACTNLLLQAMQGGQHGLLQVLAALGAAPDVDGQPGWPFAHRLSGDVLLIDRSVLRALLAALAASAGAVVLVPLALAWRRGRWPLLAATVALLLYAPWPDWALLSTTATPTSLHVSPTRFSAASIIHGQDIYRQYCLACHGASGRGDTPLGLALPVAPPNLAGPLLWRRADGDLLWHILHGKGSMPAQAGHLDAADAWAVIDYMKAHAAGTSLRETGLWQLPVALPAIALHCASQPVTNTDAWAGQRVRLVVGAADGTPPLEDPRFNNVLVGDATTSVPVAGQPAIDCLAADPRSRQALAIIAGAAPDQLDGMQLIADRDGWLRARKRGGDGAVWSDADMLCRASPAAPPQSPSQSQGMDNLVAAMDRQPVQFIKGGFVH